MWCPKKPGPAHILQALGKLAHETIADAAYADVSATRGTKGEMAAITTRRGNSAGFCIHQTGPRALVDLSNNRCFSSHSTTFVHIRSRCFCGQSVVCSR